MTGVVVAALVAAGSAFAEPKGKVEFNVRPEDLPRRGAPEKKKKIPVPSYSRNIKVMREICQAIALDGRLEEFQKLVGAQPDFSLDCRTCRPFFRTWYSACQLEGVGILKFSPPEKPTALPSASPVVEGAAAVGEGTPASEAEGTAAPADGDASTPAAGTALPEASPAAPSETATPEPSPEPEVSSAEEAGESEDDGEPKPTPTPTIRPIGPERDPNIVVLDLISKLFISLSEVEGAALSLQAIDLLVVELRNPVGKTESAREYFDTLSEFMLAPFATVREEAAAASLAAGPEDLPPEARDSVNEMFAF